MNDVYRKKEFLIETLHIFVLFSFALAQPLFDLLSRNAAFFVIRRSEPIDLFLLVLTLIVFFPALFILLKLSSLLFGRLFGKAVHGVIVAALGTLIIIQVAKNIGGVPGMALVGGAFILGVIATICYFRFQPVQMFLTLLSPALLFFPGMFLLNSPVQKVAFSNSAVGKNHREFDATMPIVMVVFDEFPVTSLMDGKRQIDPLRYPNFSAIVLDSYWYRNATSASESTELSVPSILTGKFPDPSLLPTSADHPNNLFTLLGGTYELKVVESITHLCDDQRCHSNIKSENLAVRMSSLVSDLSLVYLHILLPNDLANILPPISQNWKNFWKGVKTDEQGMHSDLSSGRIDLFQKFLDSIQPTNEPTLFFLHTVLPHVPWSFFPSGKRYTNSNYLDGRVHGEKWADDEWPVIQGFQHHLFQVGYVDKLLGELIGRLKEADLYNRSLIIITADHGVSFHAGGWRRPVTKKNYQDIMPVPLFIKLPNQKKSVISDQNVELIDILPTIAETLGVKVSWPVDGSSTLNPSLPEKSKKIILKKADDHPGYDRFVTESTIDAKYDTLKRKISLFGDGNKPQGLFKIGPHNDALFGRKIDTLGVVGRANVEFELDHANSFNNVDINAPFIPGMISGLIQPHRSEEVQLNLAVAVNGTIRATTRTFQDGEKSKFSAMVPEQSFKAGNNNIEVFVISMANGQLKLNKIMGGSSTTYTLSFSDTPNNKRITSTAGQVFNVRPEVLKGWVDNAFFRDGSLVISGWAADVKNSTEVDLVLIFINGEFIYSGRTEIHRAGVAKSFGVKAAGFTFELPPMVLEGSSNFELEVFALSKNGSSSELGYQKWIKWAKKD